MQYWYTDTGHKTLAFKCCTHIYILSFKRDLFIHYSLLYKRTKERANEMSRSFQKLNCRLYYFLTCVETNILRSIQENVY